MTTMIFRLESILRLQQGKTILALDQFCVAIKKKRELEELINTLEENDKKLTNLLSLSRSQVFEASEQESYLHEISENRKRLIHIIEFYNKAKEDEKIKKELYIKEKEKEEILKTLKQKRNLLHKNEMIKVDQKFMEEASFHRINQVR